MIEYIEKVQLKFSHLTSKLGYEVEANQAEVLHSVLLNNADTVKNIQTSFSNLDSIVNGLDAFTKNINLNIGDIAQIMSVIQSRMVSYKLVEKSLLEAYASKDGEDMQDALLGLNAVTAKFDEDIEQLTHIANNNLSENISLLKESNEDIK
jgi:hypothetical protein